LPSADTLKYFLRNAVWFAWPAWPYAGWAVYAWRRQSRAPHVVLPLTFLIAVIAPPLLNSYSEESILLPLLPPLAMLAAFGLPTMKRGAINAVDWFSVMTLTCCAAFIWVGWIAKQTGWPAKLAHNAFKLAPGFRPEFNTIAFLIAFVATAAWFVLVQWRISRRPSVLWRAVVLSSGGVILCWTLLMTLWLPWGNYIRSYAGVAHDIAAHLPAKGCVDSNVGPAQRASFAYFGDVPFARFDDKECRLLLLQDNNRNKQDAKLITRGNGQWKLLWEGRRASDRDERYRLYQRVN
jgi:4-amino-4-deoxy-L-arabinose transferase-like glycosyltransferase